MLSRILSSITAAALALTAQASIPGLSTAAIAAPSSHKNCTAKAHQHRAKLAAAKPAKTVQQNGGGAGAQMRRSPDIQILSFGP